MRWRGCQGVILLLASLSACGGKTILDIDAAPGSERCEFVERRVTSDQASPDPTAPALVWNGRGYAISWLDYGHGLSPMDFSRAGTYFAAVDEAGHIVQPAHRLLEDVAGTPALSWTGSGYGLLTAGNAITFSRLDAAGAPLGESVVVSDERSFRLSAPKLVFTGDGFGALWPSPES
jgi:hypothetical protein